MQKTVKKLFFKGTFIWFIKKDPYLRPVQKGELRAFFYIFLTKKTVHAASKYSPQTM